MYLSIFFLYCFCAKEAVVIAHACISPIWSRNVLRRCFDDTRSSARKKMWDERGSSNAVGGLLVKNRVDGVTFAVACV